MGAAGDMIMGALYDLLSASQKEEFLQLFHSLHLPEIELSPSKMEKCGVFGTKMKVLIHHHEAETDGASHHHHHHIHNSYQDIIHLVSHFSLPLEIKDNITSIYRLIGEAEAKVHHSSLEHIHFHEVGSLDAIADVTGCCILYHMLKPDQTFASPIHVGNGTVQCAHGILPVPAPATALLLQGIPYYSGAIMSELCTPTGAAILKHFVTAFLPQPTMITTAIGHGMGSKDFPQANCLRAFWGTDESADLDDEIVELTCSLDDITGEAIGFAMERLLENGALDVYTTPITMKKSRPGILLTCLCHPDKEREISHQIFCHTTTRGIRVQKCKRHILTANYEKISTSYGEITQKTSSGYGITRSKLEYDDVAAAARKHNTNLQTILNI
jgi:uncharacterized protein (TIGR00299 family) protein